VYKEKVTIKIGTIYGKPVLQTEAHVTVFEHLGEAVEQLGEEKMLEYVNYAQRLHDLNNARRKFIAECEGPEKRKIREARKAKA